MLLYARTSSVFRRCILTSRKGCIPFRKGDNMNTINATRTSATKFNTKYMVELALMVAVILVMSLTPLGYIRTPGLSITLLTVPVAVGAIILGPVGGLICGLTFGLTSFTFVTTVVTRTLEGFLTGLIFKGLHSINGVKKFSYYIASLCCPLLNTLLFMSSLVLFFYNTDYVQAFVTALGAKNPLIFVVLFVGVQGLIEAGICFIVASVVSRALYAALKLNQN